MRRYKGINRMSNAHTAAEENLKKFPARYFTPEMSGTEALVDKDAPHQALSQRSSEMADKVQTAN